MDIEPRYPAAMTLATSIADDALGLLISRGVCDAIAVERARAVAREWSRCLFDLGFDSDEEVMNRVLAHNVVGVIEALAGNDARAEHFLELAQVGSELEPANGTSTFLRACRFVRTALRARG